MKIIEKISDMIEEELEGAEQYVECALKHKEDNRSLADVFYTISTEEMRHVNLLHQEVVRIIEDYRRENGEPPADMMAIYRYLHDKQVDKATDIRVMQTMYKES